ncbi:hypothetical protein GGX14DRAFT_678380 [Mycena pura]|uniref:FAD/NAD(P)-binding domain-containing protein n=1 Tax=Mycena pura TaxID=153505 RepID=A0AAD6UXR8_9AGAR|nr:hypothetical protein GGX14DRAFT_678380 [Mycena pura]
MGAISNISQLPGAFPALDSLSPFRDDEALSVAQSIVPPISALLFEPSKSALEALLHRDAFWRDHVALSWSLRTFHPTAAIAESVITLIQRAQIIPSSIVLQEEQVQAITFPNGVSVVRAPFTFQTFNPKAQCTAVFKLIRMKTGDIKVFTVTTALQELDAVPWGRVDAPLHIPPAVPESLDVLVVGGGHAGLCISAYLKALGVNFAMVEKQPAMGDSWAKRYESTTLHTTRLFSGLPFVPFPSDYPQFVPAKLIASYYAKYAQEQRLPAYAGRECTSAVWDEVQGQWTVTLHGAAGTEVIAARHLVFAVGMIGRFPVVPDFPGKDTFVGEALHSSAYTNAARWAGKRVVIVGASTTACDVAMDCVRAGVETVTMIQRGPTRIYPQEHILALQSTFWNAHIPVEFGDVIATEDPIVLQAALGSLVLRQLTDAYDPEYYERLRKAGFLATVDGSVHQQLFCRSGAHYPDIGACAAIGSGEIKVKSDAKIASVTRTGIAFSDGTQLDADVLVYCTGFEKDTRKAAAAIIGDAQAEALERVWGLDGEGEALGCWRPSGHDRIWFHGGDLQLMRYFGKRRFRDLRHILPARPRAGAASAASKDGVDVATLARRRRPAATRAKFMTKGGSFVQQQLRSLGTGCGKSLCFILPLPLTLGSRWYHFLDARPGKKCKNTHLPRDYCRMWTRRSGVIDPTCELTIVQAAASGEYRHIICSPEIFKTPSFKKNVVKSSRSDPE